MAAFYRGIILTKSEGRGKIEDQISLINGYSLYGIIFPFKSAIVAAQNWRCFFIEEENFTKAVSFSSRAKKQNLGIRNIKGPM